MEQQKLRRTTKQYTQELMSLQRTERLIINEFDITATTGKPLAASITNELKIDKEIKVPEVKAQPSLDVDRMLDAGDRDL